MNINDLFESQEQLDELNLAGVGQGLARGVGAVSKGVGAVAGGVRGALDQAKAGYQAGRSAVSGQAEPQAVAPAQDVGQAATPQSIQSQIQQKQKEIQALQQKLEASKKAQQPAQTTSVAPAGPQKGQQVTLGNDTYQWLGAQWQNVQTKRIAEKGLINQLNKLAQSSAPPATGTPDLKVVQGGQAQQAAESYKFESKFLGMKI